MGTFNGSGTFVRSFSWQQDATNGIPITASRMDTEDSGFASGLSNCITRDGQSPPTSNIPMGNFLITGLGVATMPSHALSQAAADARYVQSTSASISSGTFQVDAQYFLTLVSGSPTINFDSNDFLSYDRANNILAVGIGGTAAFSLSSGGAAFAGQISAGGIELGYKDLPVNSQTAGYTLVLTDRGKEISITTGGVTIPSNAGTAFPVGAAIVIFNNSATAQTLAIISDTLRLAGTTLTGNRTIGPWGLATVVKQATTLWTVSGAGVS